jgi:hypothetical protein
MATVGRVLLWTVVLVAPGGFLLAPVLAAATLNARADRPKTPREMLGLALSALRSAFSRVQRYWTKS